MSPNDDMLPSEQIDRIIEKHSGWKGDIIRQLRTIVRAAASDVAEEVKWKMPTRPEGLPVWSHNGIVCFVEIWKDNIKLIFLNGAKLADSQKLFNARLKSSTLRAVELREGDIIDEANLKNLVKEAVKLNASK